MKEMKMVGSGLIVGSVKRCSMNNFFIIYMIVFDRDSNCVKG